MVWVRKEISPLTRLKAFFDKSHQSSWDRKHFVTEVGQKSQFLLTAQMIVSCETGQSISGINVLL
ncbi:hypothetical protein B1222_22670 [Paenibacillus larvae subsp. pulvifaciens]|uniref:Uncharacterized protein n=1 Tax=Paenibacillus larvae subsp. pulvifaciens TaxID=1477 RepID=A0A1V0UN79_9BACL|nr:hypothetical protein BXP28_06575 [Paenibacillus larvae subsp. larvae]AQT86554.1 hypothetical protein B1222_22670 [Paenibacillus larvae subsp. pulvifaciens]AQZ48224.1 hypothetical protein B5S25_18225 [Paenibacillus larvae subsp. pulvifaciens]ARF66723.1 hypothetical protein B7C51_01205 [Paenibacillus larvae subsp. pulvifaciens]MBH0341569.1 hypothetical protein [Paenibacillus larvae]